MALLWPQIIYIKQNYNHNSEPNYFLKTSRLASIFIFPPPIMVVKEIKTNVFNYTESLNKH